jgi:quercetin dioxygenase-like cupin family protein
VAVIFTGNVYNDIKDENKFLRTFEENVESDELIWHRDKKNREITVLEGTGWQLQMENELPFILNTGKSYYIQREVYHRVIKGEGQLKLSIKEYDNEDV